MGNTSCSCESEPAPANGSTFASEETSSPLHRELATLSNKDLRTRAKAAGATPAELDAAADSDDPKAALVALVLAKAGASEPAHLLVEDRRLTQDGGAAVLGQAVGVPGQAAAVEADVDLPELKLPKLRKQDVADVEVATTNLADDVARVSHPGSVSMQAAEEESLRSELQQLKPAALRRRAIVAGVGEEAVNDALDAEDSKAALISLVVEGHTEAGSSVDLVTALTAGSETAAGVLIPVLEHALGSADPTLEDSPDRRMSNIARQIAEEAEVAAQRVREPHGVLKTKEPAEVSALRSELGSNR